MENWLDYARRALREHHKAQANFVAAQKQRWLEQAGPLAEAMLVTSDEAMRQLGHASAAVRQVAIQILLYHWKPFGSSLFAQRCEDVIAADDADNVRLCAILALGECHKGRDNVRVSILLAVLVANEQESETIRLAAYQALLAVRRPAARGDLGSSCGLKDVDWEFVSDSLIPTRPVVPSSPHGSTVDDVPPEHADSYHAYHAYADGMVALENGENTESIRLFSEAVRLKPVAVGPYIGRGRASTALGKFDDALADFTRAIELNPKSVLALRERARVYRLTGAVALAECDEQMAAVVEAEDV